MEQFISWDILTTYATFITIVFMVVEFIKEIKICKKVKTKYLSFIIALILLCITNAVIGTFRWIDIVLYTLSAISISLGANGLSNFNKKEVDKNE